MKVDVMFRRERARNQTLIVRFRRSLAWQMCQLYIMPLASIFTALGVTARSGMPGNTRKNQASSPVTLRQ